MKTLHEDCSDCTHKAKPQYEYMWIQTMSDIPSRWVDTEVANSSIRQLLDREVPGTEVTVKRPTSRNALTYRRNW